MGGPTRIHVVGLDEFTRQTVAMALASDPDVTCTHGSCRAEVVSTLDLGAVLVLATTPGFDLVRTVWRNAHLGAGRKVVVVVSYADDDVIRTLRDAGAHAVLDTSSTVDECLAAIRTDSPEGEGPPMTASNGHESRLRAQELGLTTRQHEVLRLLAGGLTPDHVARRLGIQLSTCRDHIKAMRQALDVSSAVELVVVATRLGLLPELCRPVR